jgi:hypothetical protein
MQNLIDSCLTHFVHPLERALFIWPIYNDTA